MPDETRDNVAYRLRLWEARGEAGMVWRVSLESARTGERVGFASLEGEVCRIAEDQKTPGAGETWGSEGRG